MTATRKLAIALYEATCYFRLVRLSEDSGGSGLYHWANLRGSCTLSSPGSSQRLHTMFRLQSSPKLKNSCQTLPSLYLAAATINGLRPRSFILISLSFIKSGASR